MEQRRSTILLIQKDGNGKFLVYYDPEWGYYMFPHCKAMDEDDIRSFLSDELGIDENDISLEFAGTGQETKLATAHDEMRGYRYYFFRAKILGIPDTAFRERNRLYEWLDTDGLLLNDETEEHNEYIVRKTAELAAGRGMI